MSKKGKKIVSPLSKELRPYKKELALCQEFYNKVKADGIYIFWFDRDGEPHENELNLDHELLSLIGESLVERYQSKDEEDL